MFQPKTETSSDRLTRQHRNRTAIAALLCAGRPAEKSNTHSSSALKFSLIDLSCYFITLLPSAASSSLSPVGGILRGIPKRSNPCVCPYVFTQAFVGLRNDHHQCVDSTVRWNSKLAVLCCTLLRDDLSPRPRTAELVWSYYAYSEPPNPPLSNQHSFCR